MAAVVHRLGLLGPRNNINLIIKILLSQEHYQGGREAAAKFTLMTTVRRAAVRTLGSNNRAQFTKFK